MQIVVSLRPLRKPRLTSVHTRYCLLLSTPPNQQTPRNHCASNAIPSRWERHRDLSWCSRRQSSSSRHCALAVTSAAVRRRPKAPHGISGETRSQARSSLSSSARSHSSPRHIWTFTRGLVRGRFSLFQRRDLAGRSLVAPLHPDTQRVSMPPSRRQSAHRHLPLVTHPGTSAMIGARPTFIVPHRLSSPLFSGCTLLTPHSHRHQRGS